MGKIVSIDSRDKDGCWVEFIRVRVLVDTTKPLRRVTKVVGKNGKELLFFIKYKRLLVYCYICGRIGHTKKFVSNFLKS